MTNPSPELLHGTLDTLVLKTLAGGRRHGYAIARAIEEATDRVVDIEEGSLYPALYRMEKKGWIEAEWGLSELGPARQVLPADAERPQAAGGADSGVGALCRRGRRASCWRRSLTPAMGFFNRVAWRRASNERSTRSSRSISRCARANTSRAAWTRRPRAREAERRFGDVRRMRATLAHSAQGRNRQMQRTEYLSELRQDIALRVASADEEPGFTAVAVLTLALGIGAHHGHLQRGVRGRAAAAADAPIRRACWSSAETYQGVAGGSVGRQLHRCRRRRSGIRGIARDPLLELQPLRRHRARARHRRDASRRTIST